MKIILLIIPLVSLLSCTNVSINQTKYTKNEPIKTGEAILFLRQHAQEKTERSIVRCLSNSIQKKMPQINVLPEKKFINEFFPWFEPSLEPNTKEKLQSLLQKPQTLEKFKLLNIKYLIWLQGKTKVYDDDINISCTQIGCFGYGSWGKKAQYEATIWDIKRLFSTPKKTQLEVGYISSSADGKSYLPAVIFPVPLIAQVKSNACKKISREFLFFLNS